MPWQLSTASIRALWGTSEKVCRFAHTSSTVQVPAAVCCAFSISSSRLTANAVNVPYSSSFVAGLAYGLVSNLKKRALEIVEKLQIEKCEVIARRATVGCS